MAISPLSPNLAASPSHRVYTFIPPRLIPATKISAPLQSPLARLCQTRQSQVHHFTTCRRNKSPMGQRDCHAPIPRLPEAHMLVTSHTTYIPLPTGFPLARVGDSQRTGPHPHRTGRSRCDAELQSCMMCARERGRGGVLWQVDMWTCGVGRMGGAGWCMMCCMVFGGEIIG